jgi:23S rRNA (cytosine1962-C5)-methyltransferase
MITPPAVHIRLRPKEDLRIRTGHPWVFSNEIAAITGSPGPGDVVPVLSSNGALLGVGFYNPHSLVAARLLSVYEEPVDAEFFRKRLQRALELRKTLYPESTVYRLVHGESDFLPGLIIDRFNDLLVVQTLSSGMDMRLPQIADVLEELLHPAAIVERNESPLRELEHLPMRKGVIRGTAGPTVIDEHGLKYGVDPMEGQKTGFFLDQRENRFLVRRYCRGARVLDCFCNDGGFALNAAAAAAVSVLGIDSSAEAVARATANASRNGLQQVQFVGRDVFEALPDLADKGERFGAIILDPPSFTRSKKNVQTARRGYRELHAGALKVLEKGGYLATASCSHHILPEVFLEEVVQTGKKVGKTLQLLEWRGAAPDHPTLPQVPETRYLKFGVFRVH